MIAHSCPTNDGGFTLIEILVIVALLGLMSLLMADNLKAAIGAWPRIAASDAEGEELEGIRLHLTGLLSQSRPLAVENAGQDVIRFDGTSHQVSFLAPLPQRFGPGDIVKFILHIDNGHSLRLAWALDRDDGSTPEVVGNAADHSTEMLTGLRQGAFQYFGCGQDGARPQWWDYWTNRTTLPTLIRFRFSWRRRFETLIIAPRIEAASSFAEVPETSCSE